MRHARIVCFFLKKGARRDNTASSVKANESNATYFSFDQWWKLSSTAKLVPGEHAPVFISKPGSQVGIPAEAASATPVAARSVEKVDISLSAVLMLKSNDGLGNELEAVDYVLVAWNWLHAAIPNFGRVSQVSSRAAPALENTGLCTICSRVEIDKKFAR
jgi:hypothetical protein